MNDKIIKLANMIVNYSLKVKEKERVLITYQSSECNDLVIALIKKLTEKRAIVFAKNEDPIIESLLKETTNEDRIKIIKGYMQFEIDNFDTYIHIKYNINDYEDKNIAEETIRKISKAVYSIREEMINKRKWILLNYPSTLDSYKAGMPTLQFKDFSFDVMSFDYIGMNEFIKPLKQLMEKTERVRIVGKDTDISFSIKGMPVIPCVGEQNIPDGEIFTAPLKNSVNGKIAYNTKTLYRGETFENISLEFKDGKIINATSSEPNKDKRLNEIFDTDDGSRYVGEFAIGLNPKVLYPMGDILYDEKIKGSIHFTPGSAYKESYNGNDSSIHWDLVLIQREEYGGGELYFDDVLIRKDGVFVLEELKKLNYIEK